MKSGFLPYQNRWLADKSRMKIWEKSRRIGATWCQSFEDVRDCIDTPGLPVWFSSADESAAREYVIYCQNWAKLFKTAGEILSIGDEIIDEKSGVKALTINFKNGSRIHGLSSNPTAFRSKGGKVILDEFDWHKDQRAMYAAARPVVTWGYNLRILSTYKSKNGLFGQIVSNTKKDREENKKTAFSLHSTDIFKAVGDGLIDRILKRKTTQAEQEEWIQNERSACVDENVWLQEYCCTPASENEAFLTWDEIMACEDEKAGKLFDTEGGVCFAGMDIGRRRDKTVIWVIQQRGDVFWTVGVKTLQKASFSAQEAAVDEVFSWFSPRRLCVDQTGMGEAFVENLQKNHGHLVEGVLFTGQVKQELAFSLRRKFEDKLVRIPIDRDIRNAHHAVKKTITAAGNIRFDAERTAAGHADEFWAHALSIHAAGTKGDIFIA